MERYTVSETERMILLQNRLQNVPTSQKVLIAALPGDRDTAGTFRVSGYRCPHCSLRLYKTTFPEGRDPRLYVGPDGGSYMEPARVFGSPCGRFFAAPKGRRLSEGFFLQAVLVLDRQDKRQGEDFVKWWNDFSAMGDLNARRRE